MANPQVELHIADHGVITIELDLDNAPLSTENFLSYVNKGHYDGTIFHRVIDNFMVQGGGFVPGMSQKDSDETIRNEANNGLKNDKYTLAMARTQDPHSAMFGKVISGKEIVDTLKSVETGRSGFHDDVPKTDLLLEKAVAL